VKYLLDTNIYIDACRSQTKRDHFKTTFFPLLPQTFLSSVVAYELYISALDRRTNRLVQEFLAPMERAGRVVTPTFADWREAAEIMAAIEEKEPSWRSKLPTLLNDALIVLCARRIGAKVFTKNKKDFELIHRHKDFSLQVLTL
jgi:predicted nucleic acid-binding protein